ncbi:ROK family transcriptional regulator [Rhodobacteraceae bacterium CCMM004]|nr:ROK family transcriptional regulator [Rhodobacteraceae bacterium CCMM004]
MERVVAAAAVPELARQADRAPGAHVLRQPIRGVVDAAHGRVGDLDRAPDPDLHPDPALHPARFRRRRGQGVREAGPPGGRLRGAPPLTANQRAILADLARAGTARRGDVAARLGLSPQTMMRAVNPLVEMGILSEIAHLAGVRGKPPRRMSVRAGMLLTLGATLSEGRTIVDLADFAGRRVARASVTRPYGSAAEQCDDLIATALDLCADAPPEGRIVSAAVLVQGFFLSPGRTIVARSDPAGWARIDLRGALARAFGVPVTLVNDGRAFAASLIGTTPSADFAAVFLGSGIGGGVVSGGRLLGGATGNAGEFGALFPAGPDRPTETNLLARLGRRDWAGWPGLAALDAPARRAFEVWRDGAAADLSAAFATALALVDIDTVFVGSRAPADVLRALTARISVAPISQSLAAPSPALPAPAVVPRHIPALSHLAGRIALESFLEPHRFAADPANAAPQRGQGSL